MIYGIDLGTTYSLIGSGDELYTHLVASAVDLETKQQVDIDEVNDNIVRSYKVDMTTGPSGKLPIVCSSIVLKELAALASRRSGQEVKDVVISVPAKFTLTQRNATWQAAEKAGLNPRGLINEPTAAALYACRDYKDLIVVYDLGGGTFDVTILDSRTGQYYVIATDGNAHLAGDNLDRAIANVAMKECKTRIIDRTKTNLQKLYNLCRVAKENITTGSDLEFIEMPEIGVMYKLTKDNYIQLMKQTFASTIELTERVISENLMQHDKPRLLFVGGSTSDKYLREWVKEELGLEEFVVDCDPSFMVARGVALYASMVESGRANVEVTDVTCQLSIGLSNGMVNPVIEENSPIPISESFIASNDNDNAETLTLNLYQGNEIIAEKNTYVGTLEYRYDRPMAAGEGLVEVKVIVDRNGIVELEATDLERNDTQKIQLILR